MKKLFVLLALSTAALAQTTPTSFDVCFDFRATQAFVTDPAPCTYEISNAVDYPTTRAGATFGWESMSASAVGPRDRSAAVDPRLAGLANIPNNGTATATFRVDLPIAGTYMIGLGIGDTNYSQTTYVQLEDGAASLLSFSALKTSAGQFVDAAGNLLTSSTWPAGNVKVSKTFSGTILRIVLGPATDSNSSVINHLRITYVAPPPPPPPPPCPLVVSGKCFADLEAQFSTDVQALVKAAQSSDAQANLYLQNQLAPLLQQAPPANPPTLDAVNTAKLATATAAATVATDLGNILDLIKQALAALSQPPAGVSVPAQSAPVASPVTPPES